MTWVHFAHANGVVPAVYQEMLGELGSQYRLIAPLVFGQDEHYPVSEGWTAQVDQLIRYVESQAAGEKVVALGHSFGAVVSLLATQKRPDLFAALILLDPPMIVGLSSFFLMLGKKMGLTDKMTPAGISKHRRDQWASKMEAAELLRARPFFKRFSEASFQAYIDHGLRENTQGATLTISKQQEVAIFRTIPAFFWLPRYCRAPVPTALLVGKSSEFYLRGMTRLVAKKLRIRYELIDGGHMFPLQNPHGAAQAIQLMMASLVGK